jgi:hypothetical protein
LHQGCTSCDSKRGIRRCPRNASSCDNRTSHLSNRVPFFRRTKGTLL